jgi:hypothetical protein
MIHILSKVAEADDSAKHRSKARKVVSIVGGREKIRENQDVAHRANPEATCHKHPDFCLCLCAQFGR